MLLPGLSHATPLRPSPVLSTAVPFLLLSSVHGEDSHHPSIRPLADGRAGCHTQHGTWRTRFHAHRRSSAICQRNARRGKGLYAAKKLPECPQRLWLSAACTAGHSLCQAHLSNVSAPGRSTQTVRFAARGARAPLLPVGPLAGSAQPSPSLNQALPDLPVFTAPSPVRLCRSVVSPGLVFHSPKSFSVCAS